MTSGHITLREFDNISSLLYEKSGIRLAGKEKMVIARLARKVRESGCGSIGEYYRNVVEDSTGQQLNGLIDALSTNHSGFLREPAHFDFLRTLVLSSTANSIRIWCAAAATGEEPYTMAFSVLDALGPEAFARVRILATDISTRALHAAKQGIYAEARLSGVPADWLQKYMLRGTGRWEGSFRVKPEIRRMLEFRRLNLIEPFHHPEPFPVIFCRNVMIYFDKNTQARLVNRLVRALAPGGYLVVGHAESLTGIDHPLEYVSPATYRLQAEAPPLSHAGNSTRGNRATATSRNGGGP
ncbi:MAG: CheR family methyltransferase [Bryobacteraceae bacterium]